MNCPIHSKLRMSNQIVLFCIVYDLTSFYVHKNLDNIINHLDYFLEY